MAVAAPWHTLSSVRERELRVALVWFGGISLAVYMHGVSTEILRLVRSSRALHDIKDRAARAAVDRIDQVTRRLSVDMRIACLRPKLER